MPQASVFSCTFGTDISHSQIQNHSIIFLYSYGHQSSCGVFPLNKYVVKSNIHAIITLSVMCCFYMCDNFNIFVNVI